MDMLKYVYTVVTMIHTMKPLPHKITVPLLIAALADVSYWLVSLLTGTGGKGMSLINVFVSMLILMSLFVAINYRKVWEELEREGRL